ncbi:hypothetical protein [Nocardia mangyaensis]|uniref:hypothetical protein n=1 Tax=Nocardia mangyaensis TaxID=2213200 RepID=UPI0012EB58E1|nr:hypothetical protein [Nocardia mangyaensis]
MTVVRPPERSAQPRDDNAAAPTPSVAGAEKSRRVFFSAAIGSFTGRIVGDWATEIRREWLPKIWDWLA